MNERFALHDSLRATVKTMTSLLPTLQTLRVVPLKSLFGVLNFAGCSLCWFLIATSVHAADELPKLDLDQPLRPDFSGSWQKDFRRSDNWETELDRVLTMQREAFERQRNQSPEERRYGPGPSALNFGRPGSASIVDLARLAEYITRQSTIEIIQTRSEVRIEREGDAALICGVANGTQTSFSSDHGTEICGWERQQLVFQIRLPDDLIIIYRFSVSSDGNLLNMMLSLSSRGSDPFNLIQAFDKYDAPVDDFNCVQTLSRGRVCSQSSTPQL